MRRLLTLLALAGAISCGGDSPTSRTEVPIGGTYTLRTVNGLPLPYTVAQNASGTIELLSEAFTLTESRTWTQTTVRRTTPSGQAAVTDTVSDAGTFVLSGADNITLISGNGSTDGTIGFGVLTLANDAVIAVYQK
jgi:hypothetical protein